jgi:type IV secretory pathway VirB3-like protein
MLSKESLLYIIENEAVTEVITITLHASAYARLAQDADIVAALNNHPLVSLASA